MRTFEPRREDRSPRAARAVIAALIGTGVSLVTIGGISGIVEAAPALHGSSSACAAGLAAFLAVVEFLTLGTLLRWVTR